MRCYLKYMYTGSVENAMEVSQGFIIHMLIHVGYGVRMLRKMVLYMSQEKIVLTMLADYFGPHNHAACPLTVLY